MTKKRAEYLKWTAHFLQTAMNHLERTPNPTKKEAKELSHMLLLLECVRRDIEDMSNV